MKIYIASRYSRREEMELIAHELTAAGHEITANWVYGGENGLDNQDIAILDDTDVRRADCCLTFTEPYGSENKGGGRHFEFGLAYGLDKLCILVGPLEIVFHHLPKIKRLSSLAQTIRYLHGK